MGGGGEKITENVAEAGAGRDRMNATPRDVPAIGTDIASPCDWIHLEGKSGAGGFARSFERRVLKSPAFQNPQGCARRASLRGGVRIQ